MVSLQLHIVHFSGKFGDLGKAVPEGRGLAVLGVFFTVSSTSSSQQNVTKLESGSQAREESAFCLGGVRQLLTEILKIEEHNFTLAFPSSVSSVPQVISVILPFSWERRMKRLRRFWTVFAT